MQNTMMLNADAVPTKGEGSSASAVAFGSTSTHLSSQKPTQLYVGIGPGTKIRDGSVTGPVPVPADPRAVFPACRELPPRASMRKKGAFYVCIGGTHTLSYVEVGGSSTRV